MEKGRHRILLICLALVSYSSLLNAVPLTDVLHLSDGSTVIGRIVERLPGRSYAVEISDGQVIQCPAAKVKSIEKRLKETDSAIQTRTVVYLTEGVVFRGIVVEETPAGSAVLELENGRLLHLSGAEVWKIGSELVAGGVARRRPLAEGEAKKAKVELQIVLVQKKMDEAQGKAASLSSGSDERRRLESEAARLRNELAGLDRERGRVKEEAEQEEKRNRQFQEEYGELKRELMESDEELSRRIEACRVPETRAELERIRDAMRSRVAELLQRAELVSRLDEPDPRLVPVVKAETRGKMLAIAKNGLWADPQYGRQFADLSGTLTEADRRRFYEETKRRAGLSAALSNIVPLFPIGSLRQKDYLGAAISIGSAIGGGVLMLFGLTGPDASGSLVFGPVSYVGLGVAAAGYSFSLLEPFYFVSSQNAKYARALGLPR